METYVNEAEKFINELAGQELGESIKGFDIECQELIKIAYARGFMKGMKYEIENLKIQLR